MTKFTYPLCILICVGFFAACSGSSNSNPEMMIMQQNMPPVVEQMIPDRNLAARRSPNLALMNAFSDPEGAMLTYAAESSMPAVVTASISGNQLTVTSVGPTGASDITVTATDPGGLSATQTFTVSVVANTAPMAAGTIPPLEIATGASQSISMSNYFTDAENDALIYGATSSDDAVATVSASDIGVDVTAVREGTAEITVTAIDPDRLSAMHMFTVTVSQTTNRIVGTVIPTQNFDDTTSRNIDLSAHFSGGRGALTYRATSLDDNIATASVAGSVLTIQPVMTGRTSITATASDADMNSLSQAFDVIFQAATRPMQGMPMAGPVISTQSFDSTSSRNIDLSAHFSGGRGALTYRATSLDDNIATASVAGSVLTIQPVMNGRTSITATASDADMNSASQTFDVVVSVTIVQPPTTVGRIPNILFLETNPQSVIIDIISYFSDPQGATLTYSASVQGSVIRTSTSGSRLTITQLGAGEVTITVTAANSSSPNLSARQIFMARATGIIDLFGDVQASNYRIPGSYLSAFMYGSITSSDFQDVIRVDLSDRVTYQIDLEGFDTNVGTLSDPFLGLDVWDTGQYLDSDDDSGQGLNAQLRYTPPSRAVPVSYALSMWGRGGGGGIYRLHITRP